ncbi:hypothetical protein CPB86DRAFT_303474 [Serendipita vermifera]|nr:hypothetical protein CPB86DRAFT_303474 [Serendipita vermifera]
MLRFCMRSVSAILSISAPCLVMYRREDIAVAIQIRLGNFYTFTGNDIFQFVLQSQQCADDLGGWGIDPAALPYSRVKEIEYYVVLCKFSRKSKRGRTGDRRYSQMIPFCVQGFWPMDRLSGIQVGSLEWMVINSGHAPLSTRGSPSATRSKIVGKIISSSIISIIPPGHRTLHRDDNR